MKWKEQKQADIHKKNAQVASANFIYQKIDLEGFKENQIKSLIKKNVKILENLGKRIISFI